MKRREYPILEFDPESPPVIQPSDHIEPVDAPEHCVPCFFYDVINDLREIGRAKEIATMGSEMGRHPLYELDFDGTRLAFFQPGLTAPFAAAMLEEVIRLGCRKFVACGGAGVLDSSIPPGRLIVPTVAVRDEGTSYHYLPPAREVAANAEAVRAIERALSSRGAEHVKGKTWTTDAFYRETRDKVRLRREEGCITVEMEAAAFFAVAEFRGVPFGQILYAGDDVSGETWDPRRWQRRKQVREELFWLAAAACITL
jgi:uridine phosphorylase